jgi:1D-myo-inositol 3-kinase
VLQYLTFLVEARIYGGVALGINFLAVGHITRDRTREGFRLGGTVSYAAVTALRLGWRPGILTCGSAEQLGYRAGQAGPENVVAPLGSPLETVAIHLLSWPVTTTFANIYRGYQRTQVVEALAGPIDPVQLPAAWADVPVVLLGPLVRELPSTWAKMFANSLMAVTPQGWMRQWDADGHVRATRWENASEFLPRADVVILSRDDVGGDDTYIAELIRQARTLVVTDGWRGAMVYHAGAGYHVPAQPTREVDPTGAGDVFATAFVLRLAETGDPVEAGHFAHMVASISIEALGMDAIPYRQQVEERLAQSR